MYLTVSPKIHIEGTVVANVKRNPLTPLRLRHLTEPGTYADGGGLTLRIHPSGGRNWVLRLTVDGKRRNVGLGGFPEIRLAEARMLAQEMREAVRAGQDPIVERKALAAKRSAAPPPPAIPTFADVAETVIELRAPTWTSKRHATQWRESLRIHAMPMLGHRPIDSITSADVLSVLAPIWHEKAETATRLRQRMSTIFDYAMVMNWRTDNPANGGVRAALRRRPRRRRHHRALPYSDVPAALAAVEASTSREVTKLAFTFLVLTAARAGEVRGASWDEIDLDAATWTIPAERMKARRKHRVPLSQQALAVVDKAQAFGNGKGLVFPSNRRGGGLSNMAFAMLMRRFGVDAVPHGMRTSFRNWTLEQTSTPWAVAEAALAHTLGDSVASAYARSDLFEKRRVLMQAWGDYTLPADGIPNPPPDFSGGGLWWGGEGECVV